MVVCRYVYADTMIRPSVVGNQVCSPLQYSKVEYNLPADKLSMENESAMLPALHSKFDTATAQSRVKPQPVCARLVVGIALVNEGA